MKEPPPLTPKGGQSTPGQGAKPSGPSYAHSGVLSPSKDGGRPGTTGTKTSGSPSYLHSGSLSAVKNDYADRVAAATSIGVDGQSTSKASPTERMTGANYTRLYQQQQETEQGIRKSARQEQVNAAGYASRARDLRAKISFWQQKVGQNPENDRQAHSMINQLNLELSGIPQKYRNR